MSEADDRATEAHGQRYKHGKAARTWDAVATEQPRRRVVSKILARWMAAYEAADAEAEKAFQDLAANGCEACGGAGFVLHAVEGSVNGKRVSCEACAGAGEKTR